VKLVLALAAGVVVGRVVWLMLRPAFTHPALDRTNYRDRHLPTAAGAVVPISLVAVEGARALVSPPGPGRVAVVVAVVGFALLGLLDDLAGTGDARGFRGHLTALARGRLTTGGVKLLGGGAVALVAASIARGHPSLARLVASAAVIALAANLGNLLDRAPGRAIKASALAAVALVAASAGAVVLTDVVVVVGAGLALAPDDLREKLMLGDTGANALGGVLGVGVVLTASDLALAIVLAALVGANVLSELVSFSRIIDAVPPLRALDRAGRRD
jgi:UDP-N-acetylmuramyl pentapeptide phosphotransferase/UDP-N-acetylglucosamine-1-phosphate transferase